MTGLIGRMPVSETERSGVELALRSYVAKRSSVAGGAYIVE